MSDIYSYFSAATISVKELLRYKTYIEGIITARTPVDRKYVKNLCVDDFVTEKEDVVDTGHMAEILTELHSQECFSNPATGTVSLWISDTMSDYEWQSKKLGTIRKSAVSMDKFKSINRLMSTLNEEYGVNYNSCLVQFYRDGSSGVRLHEDLEPTMDSSHPIGVVSLGAERRVDFLHNYQTSTEPPVKIVHAKNGSMYTMQANCQIYFRHRVPGNKQEKSSRFSLSFRRFLPLSQPAEIVSSPPFQGDAVQERIRHFNSLCTQTSPDKHHATLIQQVDTAIHQHALSSPGPPGVDRDTLSTPGPRGGDSAPGVLNRDIVVIFGTSITQRMDCENLSDASTEYINVSRSGVRVINPKHYTRIPEMATQLENFATTNTEKIPRIKTVVISVGTNDIKHFRKDVGRGRRAIPGDLGCLRLPLSNLVKSARYYFGNRVEIIFQSVIPMRCMYTYTAANFLGFNKLLRDVCHDLNCGFMDVFDYFLDSSGADYNRNLYADPLHLNRFGIPVLEKCYYDYIKALRT